MHLLTDWLKKDILVLSRDSTTALQIKKWIFTFNFPSFVVCLILSAFLDLLLYGVCVISVWFIFTLYFMYSIPLLPSFSHFHMISCNSYYIYGTWRSGEVGGSLKIFICRGNSQKGAVVYIHFKKVSHILKIINILTCNDFYNKAVEQNHLIL